MDQPEIIKLIAYCGALPTIILLGASKLLPLLTSSRADVAEAGARVGMLDQLQARMANLETQTTLLQTALDTERGLRRAAEDSVARLTRRVGTLESYIKTQGGVPPLDA